MIEKAINRLNIIIEKVPSILHAKSEEYMSAKPQPDKWSKKEILGHLIDSATNNHQRFVRGQFQVNPEIVYDQDKWNKYNHYQEIDTSQIIDFWTVYNKQILVIIQRIPIENLSRKVEVKKELFTLEFLINDYVEHMEHHLNQITEY